jgi:hypothetical protein
MQSRLGTRAYGFGRAHNITTAATSAIAAIM